MSAVLVPLGVGPSLADHLNALHQEVQQLLHDAVAKGVEFGRALIQAKAEVGHGEWEAWVEAHCAFSARSARGYMRLARELPKLEPEKRQRVADMSLRDAMKAIADNSGQLSRFTPDDQDFILGEGEEDEIARPLKQARDEDRALDRYDRELGRRVEVEGEWWSWGGGSPRVTRFVREVVKFGLELNRLGPAGELAEHASGDRAFISSTTLDYIRDFLDVFEAAVEGRAAEPRLIATWRKASAEGRAAFLAEVGVALKGAPEAATGTTPARPRRGSRQPAWDRYEAAYGAPPLEAIRLPGGR